MVTLIQLALFGMFVLLIMGIVGNSGASSVDTIEEEMFLFNCPDPIFNGDVTDADLVPNALHAQRVTYNVTYTNSSSEFTGTFFNCFIDPDDDLASVQIISKPYGSVFGDCDLFCVPSGWFTYAGDWISTSLEKVQVFLTLVLFILTPINFSVFDFTIADLSGISLFIIVALYLVAYIFIGAWLYKTVSPFAGGG